MNYNKLFLLIALVGFYVVNAQTAKNVDQQSLLWTRYVAQLELSKKWLAVAEVDERFFLNPKQQNVWVFRMQGRYKLNNRIEVGSGFAYFSVNTQNPEVDPGFQIPEYRVQQDLTMRQKAGKFEFNQRYQFEQRFRNRYTTTGDYLGNDFYLRYRFRFQADYKFWQVDEHYIMAILSDEVMFNGGPNVVNNVFDQNRIYVAFQYGFNKKIAVELGFLKNYQERSSGVDFYDRDIIRISIFQKFKI
jgi:hypothetical protein